MQAQYGFGVGQDHVAVRSKLHAAALVMEQSLAGNIFKSLNLQADRGLRAAEPAGGFGDAARIGDRYQRSQHADIKAEKVHGVVPRAQWLGPAATSMHASAVQTRDLPCTKFVHLSAPKRCFANVRVMSSRNAELLARGSASPSEPSPFSRCPAHQLISTEYDVAFARLTANKKRVIERTTG